MSENMEKEHLFLNHLEMPPPYWRGSSSIFHILNTLDEIIEILPNLHQISIKTAKLLYEHNDQIEKDKLYNKQKTEDEYMEQFSNICDELWENEHRFMLKAEVLFLMISIGIEDHINKFCVYNLQKNIAESIEKLSMSEKLVIATSVISEINIKSYSIYEHIIKISKWRNAFAHGHNTDRPTKSLRHNHLIHPEEYWNIPDLFRVILDFTEYYLQINLYLRSISINKYTKSHSLEDDDICEKLKFIKSFKITTDQDSKYWYDIVKRK